LTVRQANIFVPRANARYTPVREVAFRFGYSSGYRAPQVFDEDLHVAAVGGEVVLITIDPDLRPEYSHSLNFSVDLYRNFGSAEANLLIDAFYTNIRDVFALEEIGVDHNNNLILQRTNEEGAVVAGVNLDLRMAFGAKFDVNAGFTLQRSRYKEPYEWSEDVAPQRKMHRAPNHFGHLMLNYAPTRQFNITVTGNYTGRMLVPHWAGYVENDRERLTPSFFDAGIRLAYDFQLTNMLRLQINGGVRNIFDQFQKDLDRGKYRDSEYIYGPSLPRMVVFGVRVVM
jgi:outer membrane receptor for ferrienterochelin and colicins